MNHLKIYYLTLSLLIIAGTDVFCQTKAISNFENHFFKLDFETDQIDMTEVEKYFFTTFPHDDPTLGDVVYDRMKWINDDMIELQQDGFYGFIKYRNDKSSFDSFRFTSKPFYNLNDEVRQILFVYKGKFPSANGVWPAWWLNGSRQKEWLYLNGSETATDENLDRYSGVGEFYNTPSPVNCTDWPAAGEVDIIETINGNNIIHNTIHTCPQMCDSEWNSNGEIINCANGNEGDPNAGCSGVPYEVKSPEGTFACLWGENSISFYYWEPGSDVRSDGGPLSTNPNPAAWENTNLKNHVRFLESEVPCEKEIHKDWQCESCSGYDSCKFVNLKMIFNITLCGKWAGRNFDDTENSYENCSQYIVAEGRDAIDNQFMKIEYISVIDIK